MGTLSLLVFTTITTFSAPVLNENTGVIDNSKMSLSRGVGMILPPKKPKTKIHRGVGMILLPAKPKVL